MVRFTKALVILACLALPDAATAQTEEVLYYHADAVGSVRLITNASGQNVERHDYAPFGEPVQIGPAPSRFAGSERDIESQLRYFGARYYGAFGGRFSSVDPILSTQKALLQPQQWNRYAYALNNPLRFVDPDGRAVETPWDVANVGMGVASLLGNIAAGNVIGVVVDVGGLILDVGATAVPGVPAVGATGIRAARLVTLVPFRNSR